MSGRRSVIKSDLWFARSCQSDTNCSLFDKVPLPMLGIIPRAIATLTMRPSDDP